MRNKEIFIKLKDTIMELVNSREIVFDFNNTIEHKDNALLLLKNKYEQPGLSQLQGKIKNKINEFVWYDHTLEDPRSEMTIQQAESDRSEKRCFSVFDLKMLERHFFLVSKLCNENCVYHAIVQNVTNYLPNGNYYNFEDQNLRNFMEVAIDLYLLGKFRHEYQDSRLVTAVRYFNLIPDEDFKIDMDIFTIVQGAEENIFRQVEKRISMFGENKILQLIFEMLESKGQIFERYALHRERKLGIQKNVVPYQLLIHIACKKIKNTKRDVISSLEKIEFFDILELSSSYIDLLEIFDDNIFAEATLQLEDLPLVIKNNIILENLCFPIQYIPNYIKDIIEKLYLPIAKNIAGCPEFYNTKSFFTILEKILSLPPHYIINLKNFGKDINIRNATVLKFLNHFSQEAKSINSGYNSILQETNLYDYPLIKLDENSFYLLSPKFCGYAFCKVLYATLKKNYDKSNENVKKLSEVFGEELEKVVEYFLQSKNYHYKKGWYGSKATRNEGECDLILENKKNVVFIEIKNSGLSKRFELSDDIIVLEELAGNALYAQKQILRHKLYLLKNNNQMELFSNPNRKSIQSSIEVNNKQVYAVSLCGSEVHFFSSGHISDRLIESLAYVSFSAHNGDNQKLAKINKLAGEVNGLVREYINVQPNVTVRNIFFLSTIKSLQQFWLAIRSSNTIDELIDYITFDTRMKSYNNDYYLELDFQLRLRGKK